MHLQATESSGKSEGIIFLGGEYQVNDYLGVSYYKSRLIDIYTQDYAALTYRSKFSDGIVLRTDFRYYNNLDEGDALNGVIENHVFGIMSSLMHTGHTYTLGYQRMLGKTGFPILNGYAAYPFLITWSPTGFAKAGEKSLMAKYEYDFAANVFPGFKLMVRYIKGTSIDLPKNSSGQEWEASTSLSYLIQNGPLKGLGFGWMHFKQVSDYATRWDENRITTTYTVKFF